MPTGRRSKRKAEAVHLHPHAPLASGQQFSGKTTASSSCSSSSPARELCSQNLPLGAATGGGGSTTTAAAAAPVSTVSTTSTRAPSLGESNCPWSTSRSKVRHCDGKRAFPSPTTAEQSPSLLLAAFLDDDGQGEFQSTAGFVRSHVMPQGRPHEKADMDESCINGSPFSTDFDGVASPCATSPPAGARRQSLCDTSKSAKNKNSTVAILRSLNWQLLEELRKMRRENRELRDDNRALKSKLEVTALLDDVDGSLIVTGPTSMPFVKEEQVSDEQVLSQARISALERDVLDDRENTTGPAARERPQQAERNAEEMLKTEMPLLDIRGVGLALECGGINVENKKEDVTSPEPQAQAVEAKDRDRRSLRQEEAKVVARWSLLADGACRCYRERQRSFAKRVSRFERKQAQAVSGVSSTPNGTGVRRTTSTGSGAAGSGCATTSTGGGAGAFVAQRLLRLESPDVPLSSSAGLAASGSSSAVSSSSVSVLTEERAARNTLPTEEYGKDLLLERSQIIDLAVIDLADGVADQNLPLVSERACNEGDPDPGKGSVQNFVEVEAARNSAEYDHSPEDSFSCCTKEHQIDAGGDGAEVYDRPGEARESTTSTTARVKKAVNKETPGETTTTESSSSASAKTKSPAGASAAAEMGAGESKRADEGVPQAAVYDSFSPRNTISTTASASTSASCASSSSSSSSGSAGSSLIAAMSASSSASPAAVASTSAERQGNPADQGEADDGRERDEMKVARSPTAASSARAPPGASSASFAPPSRDSQPEGSRPQSPARERFCEAVSQTIQGLLRIPDPPDDKTKRKHTKWHASPENRSFLEEHGVELSGVNFCPNVTHAVRAAFGLSTAAFLEELSVLHGGEKGEGKSDSLFFRSKSARFCIKTVKDEEHRLLVSGNLLENYLEEIVQPRSRATLLPHFYMLLKVVFEPAGENFETNKKVHHDQHHNEVEGRSSNNPKANKANADKSKYFERKTLRLLVMQNVFHTSLPMTERYDLKGSFFNRWTQTASAAARSRKTLKDLNFFLDGSRRLRLAGAAGRRMGATGGGRERDYEVFGEALKSDAEWLAKHELMDYSLLVGIHFPPVASRVTGSSGAGTPRSTMSLGSATSAGATRATRLKRKMTWDHDHMIGRAMGTAEQVVQTIRPTRRQRHSSVPPGATRLQHTASTSERDADAPFAGGRTQVVARSYSCDDSRLRLAGPGSARKRSKILRDARDTKASEIGAAGSVISRGKKRRRATDATGKRTSNASGAGTSFRHLDYSLWSPFHPVDAVHVYRGRERRVKIFLGIVDVLQVYSFKKFTENLLKSTLLFQRDISSVAPDDYAARFVKFILTSCFANGSGKMKNARSAGKALENVEEAADEKEVADAATTAT